MVAALDRWLPGRVKDALAYGLGFFVLMSAGAGVFWCIAALTGWHGVMYWLLYYGSISELTILAAKNHSLQQRIIAIWMAHHDKPCAYGESHHPGILTMARVRLWLGWSVYATLVVVITSVCPHP